MAKLSKSVYLKCPLPRPVLVSKYCRSRAGKKKKLA